MPGVEIKPGIFWTGLNDRTTDLFEGLWPVEKEGISYNSYIIKDEKNALIDLAKSFKSDVFFNNTSEITAIRDLDYVIINHMEPDHTGLLSTLRMMAPDLEILCSPKAVEMLKNYYGITENIRVVEDGEELSLGKRKLKFIYTPFVHWPETIMTYEMNDGILFSCDAFGGYGALNGFVFDDECPDLDFYIKESLRYYTNIVAKFSTPVKKAIEKLADVSVKMIAPSHGLIWRDRPGLIVELYDKWADYAKGDNEKKVTLLYGSMYGNTELMMNSVAQGISDEGVPVEIFDVARIHASYILPSLWVNRGVMIGAPTYEGSLFPYMSQMLEKAAMKNIRNKTAAYFGSYGWSRGALKKTQSLIEPLKWNMTDTFEFAGGPDPDDLRKGYEFGKTFARKIKED